MRQNTIQTNFTAGEISPLMYGRVDINKYVNGAKTLRNMIVRPQGGVCRRSGTQFIGAAKATTATRIISFVISNTVSYILEFGNLYIRFYTNGGIVGGGTPVEVVTPYLAADLDLLYVAQSVDQLFIAHPDYAPRVLTRTDNTTWSLDTYVTDDGPYLDIDTTGNKAQFTLTSDITTLNSNITAGAGTITVTATTARFTSGSVGQYLTNSSHGNLFKIEAYSSTTVVSGEWIASSQIIKYSGTMTFATSTLTSSYATFTASSVGKYVYIPLTTSWYIVTAYVNSTHATATLLTTNYYSNLTYSGSSVGTFVSTDVDRYVEYVQGGVYYLAKILTVVSEQQVTVKVLPQIFLNDGTVDINITGTSPTVATSSFTSVFVQNDIGKYIRDTNAQKWVLATSFVNSSKMQGTLLDVIPYAYPATTMTLADDRVITGTLQFNTATLQLTDVGSHVRLAFGSQWRSATITAVISPSQATATLNDYMPYDTISPQNLYNNGYADNFRLGSWSDTNGYPSIVAFHDQRLIWANTPLQPSTLWFTQPADFYNMAPTSLDGEVTASNAIYATIASGNVDPITWIRSGQVLLIGTLSGEYQINQPGPGAIAPTNISIEQQSSYGSLTQTSAFRIGVATMFLQRGGSKVREMLYQFQFNSFNSKDITIVSEHILRNRDGAKVMAYQVDPVSLFWIVCNNGDLVSCTYDRDQDIIAFAPHTIAGGTVESVAVVPNTDRDDVYLVVNRTISGGTVRYIEMLSSLFDTDSGDTKATMNFLDSSDTYSGSAATVISGLSYLEGQTVYAIADGVLRGPFTVTSGSITLPVSATYVTVGLSYTSTIETLSPDGASQMGTSQGKRKTVKEITARVKDTLPFKHGPDLTNLTLIDSANFGADLLPVASQNLLTSGDVRFSPNLAWDQQATYCIVQDQPYPMTIEALMPTLISNE